jgi:hypothetical protein
MELIVKPVDTSLLWQIFLKEPCTEKVSSDLNILLRCDFAKTFGLRLYDIAVNFNSLSNDFIHFSKFYDQTWFDVSFGLEEVSARLRNPIDEKQVTTLYNDLLKFINGDIIIRQGMNIQQHLSTSGDVLSYLKSLNPNVPAKFEPLLSGRGVFYTLTVPDHELTIFITVANSLYVKGGLFLNIENTFMRNSHDFSNTYTVAKEQREFILHELGLRIEMGT